MSEFVSINLKTVYESMVKTAKPTEVVVPELAEIPGNLIKKINGLLKKEIMKLNIMEINDVIDYLPDQLNLAKQDLLQQRINQVGGY